MVQLVCAVMLLQFYLLFTTVKNLINLKFKSSNTFQIISLKFISGIYDMNKNHACKNSPIIFVMFAENLIQKRAKTNINTTENCI